MLTVQKIAADLDVSEDTVLAWIHAKKGPRLAASDVRVGGKRATWRVSERDLEAFLSARKLAPTAETTRGRLQVTDYFPGAPV